MKNNKQITKLTNKDLNKVAAGGDNDSLKFKGKEVPLPEAKSKKPSDGGYSGNIIPKDSSEINS